MVVNAVENCLVNVLVTERSEGINWIVDSGAIASNSHCRDTFCPILETFTSDVDRIWFSPFLQSNDKSPNS